MVTGQLVVADYNPGGRNLTVEEIVDYYHLEAPGYAVRRAVVRIHGRTTDYDLPLNRLVIIPGDAR